MRLAVALLACLLVGCQFLVAPALPTEVAAVPSSRPTSTTRPPKVVPEPRSPAPASVSPFGFRKDAFVEVTSDGLQVRSKPSTAADSVQLEPPLRSGAVAMVLDGPVEASGFQWYLVKPLGAIDLEISESPPEFGWVMAERKDGEP